MGSVLVATMVQGDVEAQPPGKLHPFFTKGSAKDPASAPSTTAADADADASDPGEDGRRTKRRKTDSLVGQDAPEPKKPRQKRRNGGAGATSMDGTIAAQLTRLAPATAATVPPTTRPDGDAAAQPALSPVPTNSAPMQAPAVQDTAKPAKKVLKYNPKTGTLGSPPRPKNKRSASLIALIRYGRDEQSRVFIGDKITQILAGELKVLSPLEEKPVKTGPDGDKGSSAKQVPVEKSAHPFFSGKMRQTLPDASEPAQPPKKTSAASHTVLTSTPVSPRRARNSLYLSKPGRPPQFGIRSLGTKVPGAMPPMWPAAGMSHVRGEGLSPAMAGMQLGGQASKKSKGQATAITNSESIVTHLVGLLDLESVRLDLPADDNSFPAAPAELRLPKRRFESGRKLQAWIRKQLGAASLAGLAGVDDSSHDELSNDARPVLHPAVNRHFHSLETQLSAFDTSSCECLAWTQKYAPVAATQVLQSGKEMHLLKQWLLAMKVQSVETGGDASGDKSRGKSEGAPKKKKRKNKLDGFVIDSGDEEGELDELSDHDGDGEYVRSGLEKRSVIRSGDVGKKDPSRLKNTIVISGPHGCGKTAAVYAVAKELGFEIFEINSSSRRSGKDILERVGDMTRNHLVQQHRAQAGDFAGDGDEAVNDVQSGKQGMMTSFFKPKPAASGNRPIKRGAKEKAADISSKAASCKSQKQKQSLILLEEADVLYEEDKQFWATLMSLMGQSRRPFVVTCNDESLIPLQSLGLHGIFRFSAPPIDMAVDVCLLIAANEGHALKRAAVASLYRSRGEDLRATITELNYWCQIGIGDRKGGFDWFYPRWPKGCDLDKKGDVIRVVSEESYLGGMGWIGRDLIAATPDKLAAEEEIIRQSWDSWQAGLGGGLDTQVMEAPADAAPQSTDRPKQGFAILEAYDDFCDALSAADVCSGGAFATALQERMDPSLPALASGVREDFIIGRILLEAEPVAPPVCPHAAMCVSMQSLARGVLAGSSEQATGSAGAAAIDEGRATSMLDALFRARRPQLTRMGMAMAFDAIAVSPKAQPATHLDPSVFDRTMTLITLDVAPWIRGIVAFEHQLRQDRRKLSSLLSDGGGRKRMRTTRSAISALEGGERRLTRRERYFGNCLTTDVVLRTGAASFGEALVPRAREGDAEAPADCASPAESP